MDAVKMYCARPTMNGNLLEFPMETTPSTLSNTLAVRQTQSENDR